MDKYQDNLKKKKKKSLPVWHIDVNVFPIWYKLQNLCGTVVFLCDLKK